MQSVPIQMLKERFAYWAAKAAAGETVEVTRHNRGYVRLTGRQPEGVHEGSRFGTGSLRSVLNGPTKGKWRKILADDREESR